MEEFAINFFSGLSDSLIVERFPTAISELLVTDRTSGLQFVIEIKDNSKFSNAVWEAYGKNLGMHIYEQGAPMVPIILAVIDMPRNSVKAAIVVEWRFKTPILNSQPTLTLLSKETWNVFYDNIKASGHEIHSLNQTNCKIIKNIYFTYKGERHDGTGRIIYLRDLTPDYAVEKCEFSTLQEEFNFYLNGIPEEKYAYDMIDASILHAVREKYPDAHFKSNLLLFSSELADLRFLYRNHPHLEGIVIFIPSSIPTEALSGKRIANIPIDIFPDAIAGSVKPELSYTTYVDSSNLTEYENYSKYLFESCHIASKIVV